MQRKPYIVCHMMTSADGRINCAMTSQLPGVADYYTTPEALDVPTTVSGRVTAELEMAEPGVFAAKDKTPLGHESFYKAADAKGYEVVLDTKGKLLWPDATGMEKPYLIVTCTDVPQEYLRYPEARHISWIACGEKRIDLARTAEILFREFGAERIGIVGGPAINTAFLDAGLLDEVSLLIGAGIDGRAQMPSVFDGRAMEVPLTHLGKPQVKVFDSGAVWLRYHAEKA